MKIKGHESDAWHKKINDTVGRRKPTDADFPWTALQNHTEYYMKKKGKLSQTQIDECLLALIQKHPSKKVAIAACAHVISVRSIRNLLVNDLGVKLDSAFELQDHLQVIVATHHVNAGAVSDIESQWARRLLEHAVAGGSSRTLAQQLHDVLSLPPAQVFPDLLLHDDISRLATSVCMDFAKQLEDLRHEHRWMDAHTAVGWLSTVITSNSTLQTGTRNLLDNHFPTWGAWAAWRPDIPRLRARKNNVTFAQSSLGDLFALEGPDFASIVGSEQATLREGLIAQGSSRSQSTLQWGKSHVVFSRNPFRELEKMNVILERLTQVTDFAYSTGPEYTSLLAHFCGHKISSEVLQMLEDVQILGKPAFTTVILQILTDHEQNTTHQGMNGIRQLLPALNDPRICRMREQMRPYVVDRISNYVRELQYTLLIQVDARNQWLAAAMDLLVFCCGLQEQTWLLVHLDCSVQQIIASGPSLMTKIETLGVVRKSIRSTTTSTPTSLSSQIDAYCKAQLIPFCIVDPNFCRLVETLIGLWQQSPDKDRRELALLIADLPNTGWQFRCDCLTDLTTLSNLWVTSTLEALLHDENPDLGCFALIRLLASEDKPAILKRWRKVLSFAIEKQHETLLLHAITQLTTGTWLKLLGSIRAVFKGSDVITERRSPRIFNLELHKWSQQVADYFPTLTRLESVLKHGPAMQTLLLGSTSSNNCQLLRVLDFVENSKSSSHTKLMDIIMALLHSRNIEVIEDVLSVVTEASSKGAEACLRLDSRRQVSPEMTEVVLATNLRAGDISEPDRLALREVSRFFGINLDAEGYPSVAGSRQTSLRAAFEISERSSAPGEPAAISSSCYS